MERIIRKGGVVIGKIHTDLPMLGDEVIVETAFPGSNPDDGDQCSSFGLGVVRLEMIYEDHLEAQRLLAANPPPVVESTPAAYDSDDDGIPF